MGTSIDDCFVVGVLRDYTAGAIPRSTAMQRLGVDWYGDLLVMLKQHGLPRPLVPEVDSVVMDVIAKQLFEGNGPNGG